MSDNLDRHVKYYVSSGCFLVSDSLGFQSMPSGYALILNQDMTHYFWLRSDGTVSADGWDKWAAYRGAKLDAIKEKALANESTRA